MTDTYELQESTHAAIIKFTDFEAITELCQVHKLEMLSQNMINSFIQELNYSTIKIHFSKREILSLKKAQNADQKQAENSNQLPSDFFACLF